MASTAHVPDGLELTPYDETFYHNPYEVFAQLRSLEPIHRDEQSLFDKSWTISSYDLVRQLLTDKRLSVDPRSIGLRLDPRADNPVTLRDPNMMNLDGSEHKRLRSLVQKAFTPANVFAFKPKLKEIAEGCLANVGNEFDLVKILSKPMPTIAIAEFIGVDSKRHEDFKRWTDSLTKRGYPAPSEQQWQEIVDADAQLRSYLTSVISEREHHLKDDLVSRLIQARDEEHKLTTIEIIDMCFLMIGAGNFTTTDLISNCIYSDLSCANQMSPALLAEQTLKLDPPVLSVRRYVTEDIEIDGATIERESVVNLVVAAANHDPIARDALSFGRGLHHCLGAPLAKLEAEVALEVFRENYPSATLVSSRRSKRMDFRGFSSIVVSTTLQS